MRRVFLLTVLIWGARYAGAQAVPGRAAVPITDVEVTEIASVRDGVPARLCAGTDNAIRVRVTQYGIRSQKPVPLRLSLVLPGGPLAGTLLAEGSANPQGTGPVTTFTFSHVEIAARLRGRSARLVVRANADRTIDESDLTNNERELRIDDATDWSCHA